jgi:hypothetical protein
MDAVSVMFAISAETSPPAGTSTIHCVRTLAKLLVPVVAEHTVSGRPTPSMARRQPTLLLFPMLTSAVAMTVMSCSEPLSFFRPNVAVVGATKPKLLAVSKVPVIDSGTYTPGVPLAVTVCDVCDDIWP